jgi:hypothetical protein
MKTQTQLETELMRAMIAIMVRNRDGPSIIENTLETILVTGKEMQSEGWFSSQVLDELLH